MPINLKHICLNFLFISLANVNGFESSKLNDNSVINNVFYDNLNINGTLEINKNTKFLGNILIEPEENANIPNLLINETATVNIGNNELNVEAMVKQYGIINNKGNLNIFNLAKINSENNVDNKLINSGVINIDENAKITNFNNFINSGLVKIYGANSLLNNNIQQNYPGTIDVSDIDIQNEINNFSLKGGSLIINHKALTNDNVDPIYKKIKLKNVQIDVHQAPVINQVKKEITIIDINNIITSMTIEETKDTRYFISLYELFHDQENINQVLGEGNSLSDTQKMEMLLNNWTRQDNEGVILSKKLSGDEQIINAKINFFDPTRGFNSCYNFPKYVIDTSVFDSAWETSNLKPLQNLPQNLKTKVIGNKDINIINNEGSINTKALISADFSDYHGTIYFSPELNDITFTKTYNKFVSLSKNRINLNINIRDDGKVHEIEIDKSLKLRNISINCNAILKTNKSNNTILARSFDIKGNVQLAPDTIIKLG